MDKVSMHNTEDKNWWIEWGVEKESQFLQRCTEEGLLVGIQKSSGPAYYPEFIYQGQYLDLKTVQTPFFLAKKRYGIDPNFAVTLNTQDVVDCIHKYPKCQIVFDVDWEADTQFGVQVQACKEIRFLSYDTMQELVKEAPIHKYQNRVDDVQGNAKGSYVLDLQDMELVGGKNG